MAKILTDREMADVVRRAVSEPDTIEEAHAYSRFLKGLAELICDHLGGMPGNVLHDPGDGLGWTCGFRIDERVPDDGGVFARHDPDVVWKDGKEVQT